MISFCAAFTVVPLIALATLAKAQDAPAPAVPAPQLKSSPYLEPPSLQRPNAGGSGSTVRDAVFLRADSIVSATQQWIEASGNVELRGRRETVLADWLRYNQETGEVWGQGHVVLRRGLDWITGPEARYKQDLQTGFFSSPEFHIGENSSRGEASEIVFAGPERYEMKDVRYTTCVAGNDDWYLSSRDVDIDKSRVVGTARNATVYFKNLPVLYSPWLEFPLSNERKSGFLSPILGSTNSRGLDISIPYYWNMAPNYDSTFTPRLMTRRGLQLNAQGRYLFTDLAGEADAEVLPDDRVTKTNRYAFTWKHNQNFSSIPGLAGYLDLNKVSDDTYFADLSDRLTLTSQSNLNREGGLGYNRGPFNFLARIQSFQTLQDPNNPITPPYFREPQMLMTVNPIGLGDNFEVSAAGEYVRFRQSALIDGDRSVLYPTLAWSRRGNSWFVTARTGLHASHYDIDEPTLGAAHVDRVLPINSLDAGLVFERDANYFSHAFTQTLEPRAYYVYIPYKNQSQIPAFDTALDDFNFSQLFTENRYLGSDRIGDANQLTMAVTSRLLDPVTAEERIRLAIGQRYYFQDQRVTLTETPRSANTSDVLVAGEGRLSDYWAVSGSLEYNVNHPQAQRFDAGVRWQPGLGRVINASYRYDRADVDPTGAITQLKQIDLSGQWPFLNDWSFVARWNYSLVDSKTLEGVVGIEYNGGCWVFRIVGQRLTTTTEQTNTSIFAQFELNGLARFGTNPLELLRRSVPGYTRINDPAALPGGGAPSDYFPQF